MVPNKMHRKGCVRLGMGHVRFVYPTGKNSFGIKAATALLKSITGFIRFDVWFEAVHSICGCFMKGFGLVLRATEAYQHRGL